MNGAETLVRTLLDNGVDTCFANPGTSEMHFVAALDAHPEMHCVLCLFEGGTSGAADGYFRMKRDVAGTLLHLAPGFGNAFANLHNARKAQSGIVNVVGDHADYHLRYESPLKGDIAGISQAVSHWTRVAPDAGSVAGDGAAAIRAARSRNGQIATLVLPANTAWEPAGDAAVSAPLSALVRPRAEQIEAAAAALSRAGRGADDRWRGAVRSAAHACRPHRRPQRLPSGRRHAGRPHRQGRRSGGDRPVALSGAAEDRRPRRRPAR